MSDNTVGPISIGILVRISGKHHIQYQYNLRGRTSRPCYRSSSLSAGFGQVFLLGFNRPPLLFSPIPGFRVRHYLCKTFSQFSFAPVFSGPSITIVPMLHFVVSVRELLTSRTAGIDHTYRARLGIIGDKPRVDNPNVIGIVYTSEKNTSDIPEVSDQRIT